MARISLRRSDSYDGGSNPRERRSVKTKEVDMPQQFGETRTVNLNTASIDELEKLAGLGRDRAQKIIDHRPFESWDDLKRIKGFHESIVNALKGTGAIIGGPRPRRRPFPARHA